MSVTRVEQFVEFCPIAIANTDARHSIRHCNPAFDDLFRYHTGEARGRKLEIVAGLDDEVAAALRRAHGKPVSLTTRARRSDGRRSTSTCISYRRHEPVGLRVSGEFSAT